MRKAVFAVPQMDCSAEERLVRMALAGQPEIHLVDVDLVSRRVTVVHDDPSTAVEAAMASLGMGARLVEQGEADDHDLVSRPSTQDEARTLKAVLAINAAMFVGEAAAAVLADSSALLADSLDMFADAAVYGIALFGVNRAQQTQLRAARISGVLQLLLAAGALFEVARRVFFGSEPEAPLMMFVAAAALIANATSMWLLARHKQGGAHMKASWIFTTNDVIANIGVIVAAAIVRLTGSNVPDLVVATGIGLIVLSGAIRILRLKN